MAPTHRPGDLSAVIVFEALHPDVPIPSRGTSGSAGYDLSAWLMDRSTVRCWSGGEPSERAIQVLEAGSTLVLRPGEKALVPLGFKAQLPPGIEAQIRPRSGTSVKTDLVIANAPGTIDPDYAEEWCVPVKNGGTELLNIRHGERIAQAIFARFEPQEFTIGRVQRTTERAGGFGSTGTSSTNQLQPQRPL
jgi:dUTP pyrophosphatase